MNGQWMGRYTGSSSGSIIVNLDDIGYCYEGVAFLIDEDKQLPRVAAVLKTNDKSEKFKFKTSIILPIDPKTGIINNAFETVLSKL